MKSKDQLLADFIKSNKVRREKIAVKAGFKNVAEYRKYLEDTRVSKVDRKKVKEVIKQVLSEKPTIHLVDVLDSSGSMNGGKYENATRGITEGLKEFRNETEVKYTYSLVEFVDGRRIIEHQYLGSLDLNPSFYGAEGANTPLYMTIYNTLRKIEPLVKKDEKVLVKVYTDGINNVDYNYGGLANQLIKKLSDTFTVTLVGPANELRTAVKVLGLDDSNTLAVENNARGFEMAFMDSLVATQTYTKKVVRGEDVKTSFYSKKVGTL